MKDVIWRPQPKQAQFMARGEWEAFYGGAAGGGKSEALVMEGLRQVDIPYYKGLIVRKTYKQLHELIDKSLKYYKRIYPKARYNAQEHIWRFPSGAQIIFGNMQNSSARMDYQGQAYDFIGFDELTHFTFDEYSYLFSRCRPNGPGTECYIRATGNPGGIGHAWVKDRFISSGPPLRTIWEKQEWIDFDGKRHVGKRSRVFVPSTVFDNKELLANDPNYILSLASMPEADKQALLYGNWDSFSGQVFMEWRNDPDHYQDRKHTHVIKPFKIPKDWSIWCSMDWGYAKPFSIGWYAIDHDRNMYRIREYYGCTATPNTGVKLEPTEVAVNMRAIEESDPNLRDRKIFRVGDPAIWGSDGTESIGALFERQRIYFEKGDHARIDGKMQCHHRLTFDDEGHPSFQVFDTCHHFIRTVPSLVYSETHVEDVDTEGEDHIYDEWRYVCMKNPIAPPVKKISEPKPYDPLSDEDVKYDRYDFYRL